MSEQILNQILKELQTINVELKAVKQEQQSMHLELTSLKQEQQSMKLEQQETNIRLDRIEEQVAFIPMIKQAVLETNAAVQRLERSFEEQTNATNGDIRFLNHRIANVELDIDRLQNR
ncbi:MAG: hypothetical protein K0R67_3455 [Paenibacillus sp.]|nr:hypothetical protein [Paenibacillus sp.]